MPKNQVFKFRADKNQSLKIKNNAQREGYSHISNYLRSRALNSECLIEKTVIENNTILKAISDKLGVKWEKKWKYQHGLKY